MKLKYVISLVLGWVAVVAAVMLLWNGLMPDLFGLKFITFWQALGLLILSHILLGGFGLGFLFIAGMAHAVIHGREGKDVRGHWHNMSAEERRKFFERMEERRRKYGFGYPFGRNGHWAEKEDGVREVVEDERSE